MVSIGAALCQQESDREHGDAGANHDLHRKLQPDGKGGFRTIVTYLGRNSTAFLSWDRFPTCNNWY